jgi:hypothetical protein
MAIEILGFTIKPEISIRDIVATIGLILSPILFWAGYRRTRRNDQIRLWREIIHRLDDLYEELKSYIRTNLPSPDIELSEKDKEERLVQFVKRLHRVHNELTIFTILKYDGDLSSKIVEPHKESCIEILEEMKRNYDELKGDPVGSKLEKT